MGNSPLAAWLPGRLCHWPSQAVTGCPSPGVPVGTGSREWGESKGLFQRVVRGSGVGPLGMSPLAGGEEGGGGSTKGERGP